jgi:hypothetical protein
LAARDLVGEPEVDTEQDTALHRVVGQGGEAVIRTRRDRLAVLERARGRSSAMRPGIESKAGPSPVRPQQHPDFCSAVGIDLWPVTKPAQGRPKYDGVWLSLRPRSITGPSSVGVPASRSCSCSSP